MREKLSSARTAIMFIGVVIVGLLGANAQSQSLHLDTSQLSQSRPEYVPGECLVKFKENKSSLAAQNISTLLGGNGNLKAVVGQNLYSVRLKEGTAVPDAIEAFNRNPAVELAEPNYYFYRDAKFPNDPRFSSQWGLHNTGQTVENVTGSVNADISAPEVWDTITGSDQVVIAVLDAGVAYDHPDLSINIWQNARETADGVDNDGNGYVDDIRGWDFVNRDNDPYDFNGHGTHVAGIIAAAGNNRIGVTGVCWQAQIMPVRILDAAGSGTMEDIISGLNYARVNGAKIVNMSFGNSTYSSLFFTALQEARDAGVLVVAAAGNNATSNEVTHRYPSDYDLDNIISVAATDPNDQLATFSNYGTTSVDLAAPGVNILSTVPIAPVSRFSDDAELGEGQWTKQGTWGLTTANYISASHSWSDSPGASYANNANTALTTSQRINLAGFRGTKLSFYYGLDVEASYDYFWVETSIDGSTWDVLMKVSFSSSYWQYSEMDLSAYDGQSIYLRFRLTSDGSVTRDGVYIDNIVISAFTLPPYTYTGAEYDYYDGTSMAAPFVTGAAGLALGKTPAMTYRQLRGTILTGVDGLSALTTKVATGGRLNAAGMLIDPPAIVVRSSPTPLEFVLPEQDSTTATLAIVNTGARDLKYTIEDKDSTVSSSSLQKMNARAQLLHAVAAWRNRADYSEVTQVSASSMTSGISSREIISPDKLSAASVLFSETAAAAPSVAIVAADVAASLTDVQSQLMATGEFASVAIVDASAVTPTAAELSLFDGVLVWSNKSFLSAITLGDNLATFVDQGGGVVLGSFAVTQDLLWFSIRLKGRWESGQYYLIPANSTAFGAVSLGTVHMPSHPVIQNVTSLEAASMGYPTATTLRQGAEWVASWSNGRPLVVAGLSNGKQRVDLGLFPPSSAVEAGNWLTSTDGARLMANALQWVTGATIPNWLSCDRRSGTVAPGDSQVIHMTIRSGDRPLGSTHRKNIVVRSNDPTTPATRIAATLQINNSPFSFVLSPVASSAEAFGKYQAEHQLRLTNTGRAEDSYALAASGNRWPTTFYDSTGTTVISASPLMAPNSSYEVIARVLVDSLAIRGTRDSVVVDVRSAGDPANHLSTRLTTTSRGWIGRLPWMDTFASSTLDPAKWLVNVGPAECSEAGLNEPSRPFALNLNGMDEIHSQPVDLSGLRDVFLTYYYEKKGGGDSPELGDHLWIEYFSHAGSWVALKHHPGTTTDMTSFQPVQLKLPEDACHGRFVLRIRAEGALNNDDWLIDDISLRVSPPLVDGTEKWAFKASGTISSSPALAPDGTLYFGSSDGLLYALDSLGNRKWSAGAGEGISFSSPALAPDGTIYIGSLDDHLYAFHPDGTLQWRFRTGGDILSSVAIGADGTLYFGSDDSKLYALHPDGTKKWEFPTGGKIASSPAIGIDGAIIFGSLDNKLHAVWPDGTEKWAFTSGGAINSSPAIGSDGTIYAGSNDGRLYAIAGNGLKKWEYRAGGDLVGSPAIAPDGTIYIGSRDNRLHAITPMGSVFWTFAGSGGFSSSPAIGSDSTVFVGCDDANLYAVTPAGELKWLYAAGEDVRSAPGIAGDGTLYIGADDSMLYAIRHAGSGLATSAWPKFRLNPGNTGALPLAYIKPTHFVFADSTKGSYDILIDGAILDGAPLEPEDEIGIFTPAGLCVGACIVDHAAPIRLSAWADDDQTSGVEGYHDGELMAFRVWDASANTLLDYPATVTYLRGNGSFGNDSYARISVLTAISQIIQTIPLQRQWNWISFRVEPENADVAHVMAGVDSLVIMANGAGQLYAPGIANSIGKMSTLEGYKVFLTARDTLTVVGQEVAAGTPVPLATRWNFVSYLPATTMDAEAALTSIRGSLAIAKNDRGDFFIPGVVNSLGAMSPGKGYRLYMNSADTLVYPASSSLRRNGTPYVRTAFPVHFQFSVQTGENYSVVIAKVTLAGRSPQPGDEIGVFTTDGVCAGAVVYREDGTMALTAWQDDHQTRVREGFSSGEKMAFRLWSSKDQKEIDLGVITHHGNGTFDDGDYASLSLQAACLPQSYSLNQNFPNPFNPGTSITYQLPVMGPTILAVYNLRGQEVRRLVDGLQPAGFYSSNWDGKDNQGLAVPSGIYLYRLKTGSFSLTRKMMLVK